MTSLKIADVKHEEEYMKIHKVYQSMTVRRLSALLMTFFFVSLSYADENIVKPSIELAEKIGSTFLKNEFRGEVDQRIFYGAFDQQGKIIAGSELNEILFPGIIVSVTSDPIVVVNHYEIGDVLIENSHVLMPVTFNLVAITKDHGLPGRDFVQPVKKSELIIYRLCLINNEWKVLNPPAPRISIDVLMLQYQNEINVMSKVFNLPNSMPSDTQKEVLITLMNQYEKLKNMKAY